MSSQSSDIEGLPFFCVRVEAQSSHLIEPTKRPESGDDSLRVVQWQAPSGGQSARSYLAKLPVAPYAVEWLTQLHQHGATSFPEAQAECVHLGICTPDGHMIMPPACLANGRETPRLSDLAPGDGWRVARDGELHFAEICPITDGGLVIASVVRWTAVNPQALARERDELLTLMELHQQALWRIGHNIRTPLNAVFGMVQMVLMGIQPTGSARAEWHHNVQMALRQFEATVQDAVSTPSLSGAKDQHAQAECAEALGVARRMLQPAADAKFIRWVVQADAGKAAMPAHVLVEVLLNVLSNAIKHAPTGSLVTVDMRSEPPLLVIEVTNALDPCKPASWPDANQTTRSVSPGSVGDGVGLATSRFLIRRFGGRLALNPVHPGQCRATLHVPAA